MTGHNAHSMLIWPWGSSMNDIWIKTSFDHVLLIDIFRFYDLALIWMPMSQWLSGCLVVKQDIYCFMTTVPGAQEFAWVEVDHMQAATQITDHSSMLLWLQSTPNTYLFSLMVNILINHGSPDIYKHMILQNHSSSLRFGLNLFAAISSSDCTMCIFKRQGVASFVSSKPRTIHLWWNDDLCTTDG